MAVLRAMSRHAGKLPAFRPVRVDVKLTEAEKARRAELVASFGDVQALPTVGKPLRAQKWFQPDYRTATPKGLVLKSAKVRGNQPRWGVR